MSSSSGPPWTKDEVRELKRAYKIVNNERPELSKNDKWKKVSAMTGGQRSKRECYEKYKELLEERAKKKEEAKRRCERKSSEDSYQDDGYDEDGAEEDGELTRPMTSSLPSRGASDDRGLATRGAPAKQMRPSSSITRDQQQYRSHAPMTQEIKGTPFVSQGRYDRDDDQDDMVQRMAKGVDRMAISNCPPTVTVSPSYAPAKQTPGSIAVSKPPLASSSSSFKDTDLVVEDCDDFDIDYDADAKAPSSSTTKRSSALAQSCLQPAYTNRGAAPAYTPDYSQPPPRRGGDSVSSSSSAVPITVDMALALRLLLFGDEHTRFNQAWLDQEFSFNRHADLGFGLVQHKGGPCGVLASVQAFTLAHLLFLDSRGRAADWHNPTGGEQKEALVKALCDMLWRAAADSQAAVVAIPAEGVVMDRVHGFKTDGLTEKLRLTTCRDQQTLESVLRKNLDSFTIRKGGGVVAFTYSMILSRGVNQVRADMDEAYGEKRMLIDRHGYAAQELVNLCLIGRAHSNVFDGDNVLDDNTGKTDDHVRLRGIPCQGLVGFLTLFEAYGYFKVGDHYKQPEVPIWVVCSESHYSVLFLPQSSSSQQALGQRFDLHYYDGLANQEEDIILSVDRLPVKAPPAKPDDSQLIPPMDLVIRTRWPGAAVTWNGDPIY